MILKIFITGPIRVATCLLIDEKTKQAAVIDPGGDSDKIIDELGKYKADLKYILITHAHPDHIADNGILADMTGAKIVAHRLGLPNFTRSWDSYTKKYGGYVLAGKPDLFIKNGDKITSGTIILEVIHTPGHSKDGVCFYSPHEKILFSGDTLFAGGLLGRTDLPGSDGKAITKSLKKLFKLPPETKVIPGHGRQATIGEEKIIHEAQALLET